MDAPVMMTKEYWMASQLSVARFYGGCRAFGHHYTIIPQSKDLLRDDFIEFFTKLGRGRFIQMLKDHSVIPDAELKRMMQEAIQADKEKKVANAPKQGELFDNNKISK